MLRQPHPTRPPTPIPLPASPPALSSSLPQPSPLLSTVCGHGTAGASNIWVTANESAFPSGLHATHCPSVHQTLAALAGRQDGLVTDIDIRALNLTRHQREMLFASGWLTKVAPGVHHVAGAPPTHRMNLRLGLLSLGELSWVSYEAAAALHRFDRSTPDAVEFTTLRHARRRPRPFLVHTSQWMPLIDRVTVDGFRATSATRTIIDLAHRRAPRQRVAAAIDSAVRLGLSSPHAIERRLVTLRGSGRWGCRLIEDLVIDSGGHSPLERRFLQLVRRAGFPRPETQVIHRKGSRHVARVDFYFATANVVVEVTGSHGHSSPSERSRDAQRRNELQDLGMSVFEYTSPQVFKQPDLVIRTLTNRLRSPER